MRFDGIIDEMIASCMEFELFIYLFIYLFV